MLVNAESRMKQHAENKVACLQGRDIQVFEDCTSKTLGQACHCKCRIGMGMHENDNDQTIHHDCAEHHCHSDALSLHSDQTQFT